MDYSDVIRDSNNECLEMIIKKNDRTLYQENILANPDTEVKKWQALSAPKTESTN